MPCTNMRNPVSIKVFLSFYWFDCLFFRAVHRTRIIIPLVFATIIAIVLHPVVNLFVRIRINRALVIIWLSGNFNFCNWEITAWIIKTKNEFIGYLVVGRTIANVSSVVVFLFLIPVYVFMILFYQPLLIEFFRRIFGDSHRSKVSEVFNLKAMCCRMMCE